MLNFKQNGQNCLNFLGNKIKRGGPWCKFLDITKMYEIQAEIGAIIFKTFTIIRHNCHNMAIEFIKDDWTDKLGSPWNISQNGVAPYEACIKI